MKLNPLRWLWVAFLGPADARPSDPREPVFLAGPYHEIEADMLKSKLEAVGVPALLKNRSAYPSTLRLGVTTYDIWVRYGDLDTARDALGLATEESAP